MQRISWETAGWFIGAIEAPINVGCGWLVGWSVARYSLARRLGSDETVNLIIHVRQMKPRPSLSVLGRAVISPYQSDTQPTSEPTESKRVCINFVVPCDPL